MCTQKKREIYFEEKHLPFLIGALETEKKIIQKRVLKCVYWALIQSEYQIKLPKDKRVQLERIINKLVQSEDRSIANTSKEILKILTDPSSQTQLQQPLISGDMSQYN